MTFMKDNWCCDPCFVSKGIVIGYEIKMQMGLDTRKHVNKPAQLQRLPRKLKFRE